MKMLGIVCNNYECNGSIQINFGCEIEIIFAVIKKIKNKKFIFYFTQKIFLMVNKFIMLCDIVVIKI